MKQLSCSAWQLWICPAYTATVSCSSNAVDWELLKH